MVKSIQFWGESMGVIAGAGDGAHVPGPLGLRLLAEEEGNDPFLEKMESLWLLHWWLCTRGNLSAWNLVFGEATLSRFDKSQLIDALVVRGGFANKTLAATTLEQHATIFLRSYVGDGSSTDDTSWCPLQDLGLIRTAKDETKTIYLVSTRAPMGLSQQVFGIALIDFLSRQPGNQKSVSLQALLNAPFSPGTVFRLDEAQMRSRIESLETGPISRCIRFVDTADTQSVVLEDVRIPRAYLIQENNAKASANA